MSTPIDALMKTVPWVAHPAQEPSVDGLSYATHSGVLEIAGLKLRCCRLSDGRCVINAADLAEFFGAFPSDSPALKDYGVKKP